MSSSSTHSWMPHGRHQVNIGSSLGKALKARRLRGPPPATNTKRSSLPDRDFYSFRYNFKPTVIDANKQGVIEVTRGRDNTSVKVDHPCVQDGEVCGFRGTEQPAREWDCVLIIDEETGTYSLEKLDSVMSLTYERKLVTSTQPSPLEAKAPLNETLEFEAELERNLLGLEAGHDKMVPATMEEEEEEEEETVVLATSPRPTKAASAAALTESSQSRAPTAKPKKATERAPVAPAEAMSDADEEDLEFGQPAKRAKPSPPSASGGLALPGGSSSFAPPPPPVLPCKPSPSVSSALPPVGHSAAALDGSDSEEEWDEVEPLPEVVDDAGEGDEDVFEHGEEIDMNEFAKEMDEQLQGGDGEEDFLMAAIASDSEMRGQPISLKQLAGGVDYDDDDDDDSDSSTDSD